MEKLSYLFKVYVCIAAQGFSDIFRPLLLALRVFLSPKGIDVMWKEGDWLIRGVSQPTAGHPGLQAAWRRGATCLHNTVSTAAHDLIMHNTDCHHHVHCYPCSRCQQTRRACRVPSAESGDLSSSGGVGRKSRISERKDCESVNRGGGSCRGQPDVKTYYVLIYPCAFKRHLPRGVVVTVHHNAYLGRTALKLDNLEDWTYTHAQRKMITWCISRTINVTCCWNMFLLLSCETFSFPKGPVFLSKMSVPVFTSTETFCLPYLTIFTWGHIESNLVVVF